MVRPQHQGVAAAVAALVGVEATAAGAGIGIRHLQKTGLSAGTVAGLALLLAGLTMLACAGMVLWRALRGWWRLLLVPVVLVVLQVAFSAAMGFSLAVVPPTALGPGTPADHGLRYQDVTFRTDDGVRLSAWLVPSRNGAAVVLAHGAGTTRTSTLRQAAVLGGAGYGLLVLDARGHGRSDGAGMDLGWFGDQDLTAAVDFLARQPGVAPRRIGVVGLSMGGEEAIGAAAADSRIRAVVAEGATGRTAADIQPWAPGGVEGLLERGLNTLTYGLADLLTAASEPAPLRDSLAASRGTEFLLITAGKEPNEATAAAYLRAAAPSRVVVWEVPDASHTGALGAAPRAWEEHVVGFLDSRLESR